MNRTIKEATVKKGYYKNHDILEKHLQSFINAYNYANLLKGLCPYEKICLYLRSKEGNPYFNPNHEFTKGYIANASTIDASAIRVFLQYGYGSNADTCTNEFVGFSIDSCLLLTQHK